MVRKYEVKIADYRHWTTNKARSKLKKKTRLLFSYFASRMSFEKVRDALVYSLVDEIIDEEEFVLLFDAYKSVNLSYPYWEYDCFCLDSFDSSECLTEFRVNKEDLPRLAEILGVPPQFRCSVDAASQNLMHTLDRLDTTSIIISLQILW